MRCPGSSGNTQFVGSDLKARKKSNDRMKLMKSQNFRSIFLLGAVIALGSLSAAHAQVAVYGTVSAERMNSIACLDSTNCAANNGSVRPYGGTVGVYYDFKSYGPIRIGGDLRGVFLNSNKRADFYSGGADAVRHYAGLGGLRATYNSRFKVLKPYVEVAGGYAKTDANSAFIYKSYGQVQGFVGLDLALFHNFDLRAIEFGEGAIFGDSTHNVQTIGLGVVFHTARDNR